jgi:hypothetical protein
VFDDDAWATTGQIDYLDALSRELEDPRKGFLDSISGHLLASMAAATFQLTKFLEIVLIPR